MVLMTDVWTDPWVLLPWIVRQWFDPRGAFVDLVLVSTFSDERDGNFSAILKHLSARQTWAFISCCVSLVVIRAIYFLLPYQTKTQNKDRQRELPKSCPGPLFLPCRTTHTRLFPEKHSFGYSYFYVCVPVRWRGSIGTLFSTGRPSNQGKEGWFSVDADDYLDRGSGSLGLDGKLDAYLKAQGSALSEFESAYLVTAPRFCEYQFNPVSFWYLYGNPSALKAMILEVNNTFDERRMYFLDKRRTVANGFQESRANGSTKRHDTEDSDGFFRHSWEKDFHVSPFNSRKGSYSMVARDLLSSSGNSIDNQIIMKSNKDHTKLVTRVFSTDASMDPTSLTRLQAMRLILSWWWVGFMTSPRILKEAWRLYFTRKLHVWFRPEVEKKSMGRQATEDEKVIERWFSNYLKAQVRSLDLPLALDYFPAGRPTLGKETFLSRGLESSDSKVADHFEIRVLSPEFYNRLIRHPHSIEACTADILLASETERTLWVSDPQKLPEIFNMHRQETGRQESLLERLRWIAVLLLRPRPLEFANESIILHKDKVDTSHRREEIRPRQLSDLDNFVQASDAPQRDTSEYRRAVKSLYLTSTLAFGFPAVLTFYDFMIRLTLVLIASTGLVQPPTLLVGLHIWAGLKGAFLG